MKETRFEYNGTYYYCNEETRYCYAQPIGGMKKRIKYSEYEEAVVACETESQLEQQELMADEVEEEPVEKPAKRAPRRRANRGGKEFELDGTKISITANQADFLTRLPHDDFWDNGLDSALWIEVLTDNIGGQFQNAPMKVGAMISTLREKGLLRVGIGETANKHFGERGRKAKYIELTELGKKVAKEMGLE